MNFKAIEIIGKPYIYWQSTTEALGGIVIDESAIPVNVFGICPLKIVAGELVDRTALELSTAEDEYNLYTFLNEQADKLNDINSGTFTYDSQTFPMDERSRLFYFSIENSLSNEKAMTTTGELYSLLNANIPAFITAYKTALHTLSQPDV
ncbi:hypothetical protein FIA58_013765 [Flavobacterium jejuense]|uniref:DUF1795 domain-containing protein n=1 Tax=Flavobacterium jejuense TaxID=1544455 RepID=A0ABX0ISI7_9FLAO|nr:hypothetical protein [Flavobacterium jejuense]NHN26747.1 hypothetical protein [Flavobacterium jejuense]